MYLVSVLYNLCSFFFAPRNGRRLQTERLPYSAIWGSRSPLFTAWRRSHNKGRRSKRLSNASCILWSASFLERTPVWACRSYSNTTAALQLSSVDVSLKRARPSTPAGQTRAPLILYAVIDSYRRTSARLIDEPASQCRLFNGQPYQWIMHISFFQVI